MSIQDYSFVCGSNGACKAIILSHIFLLFYAPNQEVDLPLFFIAHESGGKTSFIKKVFSLRLFCKRRQMGAQLLSYWREFSFILAHVFIAFKMPCRKVLVIKEML